MHWLAHFFGFGAGDGNSAYYLFWSGAGSDLAYLTVLAALFGAYRKHNCRVRWCWRLGRHEFTDPDTGVSRSLCHVHHPDVHHKQLTRDLVAQMHRRHLHLGKHPGKG